MSDTANVCIGVSILCRLVTCVARAVEHDLVPVDAETMGHETLQIGEAAVDFEHPVAGAAAEMVVVALASDFIALRLTRQFHRRQPAFRRQGFERPVDRGDAQTRRIALSSLEDFFRAQGPVGFFKCLSDSLALACITFHDVPSIEEAFRTRVAIFHSGKILACL